METVRTLKINSKAREICVDLVAMEVPFTLNLNNRELVTLLCMPSDLKDLAIGFLYTSGFIKGAGDIISLVINDEKWTADVETGNNVDPDEILFKRLYTSGCGKGILFYNVHDLMQRAKKVDSDLKVRKECISALMTQFQKKSSVYLQTGGVHSAALADEESILVFREDIGRHNALDKVIGSAISEKIFFENKILMTSGRISSEVLFKVKKSSIPIVVSRSAVTDQAVKLSREFGITLVGFARNNRMNVYSAEERII